MLPADHRLPYEIEDVIFRIFDAADYVEFQPEYAPEMLCANARLEGRPVAVIANRRGFLKAEGRPRIGGIIYAESARKVAYFVEAAERLGTPLVYMQDVSGFMVGPDAEREGIIRAGAEMVETMCCATVPKIVVTLNHASGAGYYAMAGQGFDPNFTFSWPTARIGVMEGESAVVALYSAELEKHKGGPLPEELREAMERTRADYERWLDARYAAARGHCDAVIDPLDTRGILSFALEASMQHPIRASLGASMIRIANGQGFWGDWLEAPVRLVEQGPIDYLALDYLAEVTMSILQKQRQADPNLGYARDFPPLVARIARQIRERGVTVIANAGGVNPAGLRPRSGAPRARAEGGRGAGRRRVFAHRRVLAKGYEMRDMDTGEPIAAIRDRIQSANAYIGAFPMARGAGHRRQCGDCRTLHRYRADAGPHGASLRLGGGRFRQARRAAPSPATSSSAARSAPAATARWTGRTFPTWRTSATRSWRPSRTEASS